MIYLRNMSCNISTVGRNSTQVVDESVCSPCVLPIRDKMVLTYPRKRMYLKKKIICVLQILYEKNQKKQARLVFCLTFKKRYQFGFEKYYPISVQWIFVDRLCSVSKSETFPQTCFAIHRIPIRMYTELQWVRALKSS